MHDKASLDPLADRTQSEAQGSGPATQVIVEASESFNYAAWQNAVPLLRSVVVKNVDGPELSSLTVELNASPNFAKPKRWTVDRLGTNDTVALRNIDLEIDPEYLDRLDEAERGTLTFRLMCHGDCLHEVTHVLRILARDEWGGIPAMGNILPAFVTPNDPALVPLLRSTATVLGQNGHSTGLDGYQSGDPNRAFLLAAALWSAVAQKSLVYANPPASFERVGQKTRRVGTVLSEGLATCLDTTLLFASGLEGIGLNPVLVMTAGHCFVGVWLVPKTFHRLIETDCGELRKAIAAKELIVFETTLITHRPAARFQDAVNTAMGALAEEREHEFVAVIDVSRARMSQVLPLASHAPRRQVSADDVELAPLPLPASPGFDKRPAAEVEERPTTPVGRIERWQRKLLDLSLRNRLLNFVATKQSVTVLCPNLSRLEDRLAEGTRMRLVSLSEANPLGQRDARLHQARTQKDLDWEFARQAFDREEIACPVEARDLESRLTALFRKVKSDLAEGGSNTLYLAVGFLRWKQSPNDTASYRAPLLLVPVTLTRRSASSPFYLAGHEDDVRFNATLLQLLKKDFDCDLTSFESNLPMDDRGVDVPLVLERMRQAVREIPGFEVVEEAAIATFSFAKYLMWKDLVDRVGQLENNRIVRHLIRTPDKAFSVEGAGPMPRPHEIDTRYTPQQIVHPLPADSSQLAAVMAASEGHDLVIVGPPGTGKSQTIANLITQCLAIGKTVLFVAEKTAALDVVYRRLREHGLDDCCVELHSNKAERRRFLDQLEMSWKNRSRQKASDWAPICKKLHVRRDQLNAYSAALHTTAQNGWTVYRAMGECVRGREVSAPRLTWPTSVRQDSAVYAELEETIGRLAVTYQEVSAGAAIPRVEAAEWSMTWQNGLVDSCEQLEAAATSLAAAIGSFSATLGLTSFTDISATQLSPLYRLCQELTRPSLPSTELLSHPRIQELEEALERRQELLSRSRQANELLDVMLSAFCSVMGNDAQEVVPEAKRLSIYSLANEVVRSPLPPSELVFHHDIDAVITILSNRPALIAERTRAFDALVARSFNPALIDRIQVDALESQWNTACAAFWPLSLWKKHATTKKLKAFMTPVGAPEPDLDFQLLREYRDACTRAAENLESLPIPKHLRALIEKDPQAIDRDLDAAAQLRDAIKATGRSPAIVGTALRGSYEPLIAAARQLYPPARDVETVRVQLAENLDSLAASPELKKMAQTDAHALIEQIQTAIRIQDVAAALGLLENPSWEACAQRVHGSDRQRREMASECGRCAKRFQEAWAAYTRFAVVTPVGKESAAVIEDAKAQAQAVLARRTALKSWTSWTAVRRRAEQLGLRDFVEALQARTFQASEAVARFRLAYARWWLPSAVDQSEPLRAFQKFLHEGAVEDFRRLDDMARKVASLHAREAVLHGLPPSDEVPRKSELGLLRHQMSLKRPSKSIREMIVGMPESFRKLAPCLMMSPLSIAQYLPADQSQFDVVVFDEASQIPTWDAIGAIARGKQTIIVGDPKQLPPTNFFGRSDTNEDAQELEDHERDLESILDEVQASGLPTLQLNWHYRSKHESLIAFSNWNYYGNRLVTFPAAESIDRGVCLRHIADGIYDRGKSRTNRHEATAIVADLVERMKRCLTKPEGQRLTYGVVTFNGQQQELIQDLLDEALRQSPELEWFFADERVEPTMVKNLENVQGDERDVMMFSITFGKDLAGNFGMNFGAINRDGGERRLNVAITRARHSLIVYASFLPEQMSAKASTPRGVRDLKAFLEYAHQGPKAIAARNEGSLGESESPLEEAVADSLRARGWQVETQVGVSGFRIDLGIVHPEKPGVYLAGIECDGATYHRSAVARDRDKIRQQVLENLGWKILRVWSTDWWYDSKSAMAQLDGALQQLLRPVPQETSASPPGDDPNITIAETELQGDATQADSNAVFVSATTADASTLKDVDLEESAKHSALFARQVVPTERAIYRKVLLADATCHQDRFFDADYSETLAQMARMVLEAQGPILDDALVREIARAHGFARTGNRIKQRVLELLPHATATEESAGTFLWPGSAPQESIPFRFHSTEADRRSLNEIAMPELIGLARDNTFLANRDDFALALAKAMGLGRLASQARARMEEAIAAAERSAGQ